MNRESGPVTIVSIDHDNIEKDGTFSRAYAFYLTLSEEPSQLWQQQLLKWEGALRSQQRDVQVVRDKLRVVLQYGDDIGQLVEHVRRIVHWANERVEEQMKRTERSRYDWIMSKDTEQKDIDEIREKLKGL